MSLRLFPSPVLLLIAIVAVISFATITTLWVLQAPTAEAANFTVTNTLDVGAGSLRQAILNANSSLGTDTINFNIPGAGPHTIQPSSELPTITDPVIIDGYTQPGASPNSNGPGLGLNTVLKIELDGSIIPAAATCSTNRTCRGLHIIAGNSTVRGLVINRFFRVIELFAPVSPSPASFGVTPLTPRSIPSPALERMELESMALLMPVETLTPSPPFRLMRLPAPLANPPMMLVLVADVIAIPWLAPGSVPPIMLSDAPLLMITPLNALPRSAVPVTSVPM